MIASNQEGFLGVQMRCYICRSPYWWWFFAIMT